MVSLRAAAQQALEALEYMHQEKCDYMRRNNLGDPLREDAARLALPAITALRAALAEPAPKQKVPSVASKAVLAAIRAANFQLVRTGDDAFMLVTLKQPSAQLAAIGAGGVSGPLLGAAPQSAMDDAEAAARRNFPKWWHGWGASLCGVDPYASSPPQTYAARGFMGGYVAALAAPQQAEPAVTDWDVRGELAKSLTCWHRLTGQEAAELVTLYQRLSAPQQEVQEPWETRERFYEAIDRVVENVRQEMKVKTVTMRLPEYDIAIPIIDAYGGHVLVGPVLVPPQQAEPVAWLDKEINCAYMPEELDDGTGEGLGLVPLYTAQPQRHPHRTVTYVCPVCAASLEKQG